MKLLAFLLNIESSLVCAQDGLEASRWRTENWGNRATIETIDDEVRGSKVLRLNCEQGSKEKIVISRQENFDATERCFFVFDVRYRFETAVTIAIGFSTGERWTWLPRSGWERSTTAYMSL